MSDTVNPYQSPATAAVPEKPLTAQGNITETMLIHLKGAAPWLRFIGILGFIGSGLTALWGIIFIAIVPVTRRVLEGVPELESIGNMMGAVFGGSIAVLLVGMGVLMFFPSLFMYRFGDKIRSYLRTGTDAELELALKNNASLWKFLGILCIIELAFIPLMVIGGIIAALVSAFA